MDKNLRRKKKNMKHLVSDKKISKKLLEPNIYDLRSLMFIWFNYLVCLTFFIAFLWYLRVKCLNVLVWAELGVLMWQLNVISWSCLFIAQILRIDTNAYTNSSTVELPAKFLISIQLALSTLRALFIFGTNYCTKISDSSSPADIKCIIAQKSSPVFPFDSLFDSYK